MKTEPTDGGTLMKRWAIAFWIIFAFVFGVSSAFGFSHWSHAVAAGVTFTIAFSLTVGWIAYRAGEGW